MESLTGLPGPTAAGNALPPRLRFPSYPSYVAGEEVDAERHFYTVTTSSILNDVFTSLTLKRRLERGTADPADCADFVVGRCAQADADTVERASRAAAEAAPLWARSSKDRRLAVGRGIRERLQRNHARFVDVLIAEGSPRALAEWQVAGLLEIFSPETLNWCAGQPGLGQVPCLRGRLVIGAGRGG